MSPRSNSNHAYNFNETTDLSIVTWLAQYDPLDLPPNLGNAFRLGPIQSSLGITQPIVWLANLSCDFQKAYSTVDDPHDILGPTLGGRRNRDNGKRTFPREFHKNEQGRFDRLQDEYHNLRWRNLLNLGYDPATAATMVGAVRENSGDQQGGHQNNGDGNNGNNDGNNNQCGLFSPPPLFALSPRMIVTDEEKRTSMRKVLIDYLDGRAEEAERQLLEDLEREEDKNNKKCNGSNGHVNGNSNGDGGSNVGGKKGKNAKKKAKRKKKLQLKQQQQQQEQQSQSQQQFQSHQQSHSQQQSEQSQSQSNQSSQHPQPQPHTIQQAQQKALQSNPLNPEQLRYLREHQQQQKKLLLSQGKGGTGPGSGSGYGYGGSNGSSGSTSIIEYSEEDRKIIEEALQRNGLSSSNVDATSMLSAERVYKESSSSRRTTITTTSTSTTTLKNIANAFASSLSSKENVNENGKNTPTIAKRDNVINFTATANKGEPSVVAAAAENKSTTMKYDEEVQNYAYAWCCDYCKTATFPTFAETALHESKCPAYFLHLEKKKEEKEKQQLKQEEKEKKEKQDGSEDNNNGRSSDGDGGGDGEIVVDGVNASGDTHAGQDLNGEKKNDAKAHGNVVDTGKTTMVSAEEEAQVEDNKGQGTNITTCMDCNVDEDLFDQQNEQTTTTNSVPPMQTNKNVDALNGMFSFEDNVNGLKNFEGQCDDLTHTPKDFGSLVDAIGMDWSEKEDDGDCDGGQLEQEEATATLDDYDESSDKKQRDNAKNNDLSRNEDSRSSSGSSAIHEKEDGKSKSSGDHIERKTFHGNTDCSTAITTNNHSSDEHNDNLNLELVSHQKKKAPKENGKKRHNKKAAKKATASLATVSSEPSAVSSASVCESKHHVTALDGRLGDDANPDVAGDDWKSVAAPSKKKAPLKGAKSSKLGNKNNKSDAAANNATTQSISKSASSRKDKSTTTTKVKKDNSSTQSSESSSGSRNKTKSTAKNKQRKDMTAKTKHPLGKGVSNQQHGAANVDDIQKENDGSSSNHESADPIISASSTKSSSSSSSPAMCNENNRLDIASLSDRDLTEIVMKPLTIDYDDRVNDTALPQPNAQTTIGQTSINIPQHPYNIGQSSSILPPLLHESEESATIPHPMLAQSMPVASTVKEQSIINSEGTATTTSNNHHLNPQIQQQLASLTSENEILTARNAFLTQENQILHAQNEELRAKYISDKRQSVEAVQRTQLKAYIAETARDAAEERAAQLERLLADALTKRAAEEVAKRELNDGVVAVAGANSTGSYSSSGGQSISHRGMPQAVTPFPQALPHGYQSQRPQQPPSQRQLQQIMTTASPMPGNLQHLPPGAQLQPALLIYNQHQNNHQDGNYHPGGNNAFQPAFQDSLSNNNSDFWEPPWMISNGSPSVDVNRESVLSRLRRGDHA